MRTSRWRDDQTLRIETGAVDASRLSLLALTVGFGIVTLTGTLPSLRVQMILYLIGMVGLNLPHGGYEHFENLRNHGLPFGARYVAAYLGFIAVFVGLFFAAPLGALALAFATAVAKGGHGDLRVLDAIVGSDHLVTRFQRVLAVFVRGGAVMIVPLVFWTGTYHAFSSYMVGLFDPAAAAPLWDRMQATKPVLGGVYAVAVVTHLGFGYHAAGFSDSWLADLGETMLLVVYFAVVPVVVSIGLYFPLWYSMRQSGRTVAVNRASATDDGLPVPLVWGTLIAGGLVTGLLAAVLWLIVPNPLGNTRLLPGLVAFYTIFICVVALPHVVVGEWLDFKRGIWYVP